MDNNMIVLTDENTTYEIQTKGDNNMCQYDYSKLKGRIVEKFGKQTAFAEYLGKDDPYVSRYLTGKAVFTQKVIELWRKALELEVPDIGPYFFMPR